MLAGALAALGRRRDLDTAAATGILLAGALALGSLLVSDVFDSGAEVDTLLLGSLFGVGDADLVRAAAVLALVAIALAVQGRGWLLLAFDAENARALGVRRGPHDLVLLSLLALSVVAAVDAVGALLASSLLVIPAAAARLLTRRALPAMAVASGLALAAATGGILLSYHLDAPPGATVVLVAAGLFAVAAVAHRLAEPRRARRTLAIAGAVVLVPFALAGCGGGDEDAATANPSSAPPARCGSWRRRRSWPTGRGRSAATACTSRRSCSPTSTRTTSSPAPTPPRAVADADVVLASGAGLDEWADDLVASGGGEATLVELAPEASLHAPALQEQADHDHADEPGHDHGDVDPHFWHDPTLAALAVGRLGEALAAADPDAAAAFRAGAAAYEAQLADLDEELQATYRHGAAGEPQARHRPRRVGLPRAPLRLRGRRRGHPVHLDGRRRERRGHRPAHRRHPRAARAGGLLRGVGRPGGGRAASRTRRVPRSTTTSTATRSARRTPTQRPTSP